MFLNEIIRKGCNIELNQLIHYDVDEVGEFGCTPLSAALLYCNNNKWLQLLIEAGADVNKACEDSDVTPLIIASGNDDYEAVELLIEAGAYVNSSCDEGWTPLHTASFNGNGEIVNLLTKNGADVDKINNKGKTPLHIACENDHMEIVHLLLCQNSIDVKSLPINEFNEKIQDKLKNYMAENPYIDTSAMERN